MLEEATRGILWWNYRFWVTLGGLGGTVNSEFIPHEAKGKIGAINIWKDVIFIRDLRISI
jgi:hypothetical protein